MLHVNNFLFFDCKVSLGDSQGSECGDGDQTAISTDNYAEECLPAFLLELQEHGFDSSSADDADDADDAVAFAMAFGGTSGVDVAGKNEAMATIDDGCNDDNPKLLAEAHASTGSLICMDVEFISSGDEGSDEREKDLLKEAYLEVLRTAEERS